LVKGKGNYRKSRKSFVLTKGVSKEVALEAARGKWKRGSPNFQKAGRECLGGQGKGQFTEKEKKARQTEKNPRYSAYSGEW